MMQNNGELHFWGMHLFWWFLILVFVFTIVVMLKGFRKGK